MRRHIFLCCIIAFYLTCLLFRRRSALAAHREVASVEAARDADMSARVAATRDRITADWAEDDKLLQLETEAGARVLTLQVFYCSDRTFSVKLRFHT